MLSGQGGGRRGGRADQKDGVCRGKRPSRQKNGGAARLHRPFLPENDLVVLSALVCVLVLMADGAGGDQLALQIGLHCGCGIALYADDDLHAALIEDIHSAASHAAGNDDLRSVIGQEVGQEAWTVSGLGTELTAVMAPSAVSKKMKFSQWPKWPATVFPMAATAIFMVVFSFF